MKQVIALLLILGMSSAVPTARAQSINDNSFYEPIYWSGFYAGANFGGAWGSSKWSSSAGLGQFDTSGGLIGGTAGYNWRSDRLVLGLETDFDWSGIGNSSSGICGLTCDFRNGWLSTVRGRVGYAFGQLMPYVTGGLAFGDLQATGSAGGASAVNTGWAAGFGLEYALTENWNLRAEYLHVDLGDFNCGLACNTSTVVNVNENLIRIGLSYQFPVGNRAPQVAALEPRPGDTNDPGPKFAKKRQKSHDASKKQQENVSRKQKDVLRKHMSSAGSLRTKHEF